MMLRWSPEYTEIIFWRLETSIHKGRYQKLFKNAHNLKINAILGKLIKAGAS